jgi:hypothetical protein
MLFEAAVAEPFVQCIVHDEPVCEHPVIVVHAQTRKPERNRKEPRRLRREVQSCGVRPSNDLGEIAQAGIVKFVVVQECVKTALIAAVTEVGALDIERNCAPRSRKAKHIVCGREQKRRVLVNEPRNQPWTGHTIDLRPFAGNPAHVTSGVERQLAATRSSVSPNRFTSSADVYK